ncbi:MAG: cytochrome C [Chitinophagaceae bacterium]
MLRKFFKVIAIIVVILILAIAGLLIYVKKALPDVGPAPEITIHSTPAMIERGQYLATHVTVCIDCHSTRDWAKFAGPIIAGTEGKGGEKFDQSMGFPGTFYARNITPFNLKDWTDGEIYRTITTGVTKDGQALFPVMPYHYYSMMDPKDVDAIIAYIRTLPAIDNTPHARHIDFPMNFIINTIPQKAHPMALPPKSDTLAYGHYLVEIAGCQACHTKQEKGKIVGVPFAGGWAFNMPNGTIVRSANLTPDKETGIGGWSKEAFINLFKSFASPTYQPPIVKAGQMQTPMPWNMYGGMDTSDLAAIYTYLHSLGPVENRVVMFSTSEK